jgi:hypothetical protein
MFSEYALNVFCAFSELGGHLGCGVVVMFSGEPQKRHSIRYRRIGIPIGVTSTAPLKDRLEGSVPRVWIEYRN